MTVGESAVLFLWVIAMGSQCWQGESRRVFPRFQMSYLV